MPPATGHGSVSRVVVALLLLLLRNHFISMSFTLHCIALGHNTSVTILVSLLPRHELQQLNKNSPTTTAELFPNSSGLLSQVHVGTLQTE